MTECICHRSRGLGRVLFQFCVGEMGEPRGLQEREDKPWRGVSVGSQDQMEERALNGRQDTSPASSGARAGLDAATLGLALGKLWAFPGDDFHSSHICVRGTTTSPLRQSSWLCCFAPTF